MSYFSHIFFSVGTLPVCSALCCGVELFKLELMPNFLVGSGSGTSRRFITLVWSEEMVTLVPYPV